MSSKKSIVIRTVLALLLLIIGIGAIWMYWVYKHPLEAQARKMRRSLDTQGLERVETELSGRRSVYWVGGEGPLLVLLHGAGHQAGAWAPIVTPLLQEYRLLIPDLPGHGDSEPGSGPLAFDEVYSGLEALLASFADQPPPVLLGNSMGAWLSMFYAYDHPEAVDRVVAVNGGPITGDPSNPSLVPADREAARELMAMLRDPSSPAIPDFVLDDIVRRTASGPIGRLLQAPMSFAPFLLDGHLGELTVPVDLVWGASDRLMSLEYAARMLAELPRARLTEVPSCGHIPQNECPSTFAQILLGVLDSEPPMERNENELPGAQEAASETEPTDDPS